MYGLSHFTSASVYRAEYGKCRSEMGLVHAEEDRFVFGGVIVGLGVSYALYELYRKAWCMYSFYCPSRINYPIYIYMTGIWVEVVVLYAVLSQAPIWDVLN